MSDIKKIIGERLKTLRENKGLKQNRVAKMLGVHNSTLAKYESGEREPDNETLTKIAEIYEVTLDYLLTGDYKTKSTQSAPHEQSNVVNIENKKDQIKSFSERLNKGIENKNISVEEVAKVCNVTSEYIQELMTAPKRLPGANTLFNLAMLLDVTPDYLGGFTDNPKGTSPYTPRPKEMTEFLDREEVMFDGVPLTEEDKEKVKNVLAAIFMDAKKRNKRK